VTQPLHLKSETPVSSLCFHIQLAPLHAGVANRTTVADGNTWNHEHIALLGKCLTSPEEEGHKIVRHLVGALYRI
jgi:hypothetical protein